MLIDGKTMEQFIAEETTKRTVKFWGDEYEIEPEISKEIIGDGLQLIYVGTVDQRPNYWLIRIDSKTDIEGYDFDIEEIVNILEEEFGIHPNCYVNEEDFNKYKKNQDSDYSELRDYNTYEEFRSACEYPAVWWSGGHWGVIANFGLQDKD